MGHFLTLIHLYFPDLIWILFSGVANVGVEGGATAPVRPGLGAGGQQNTTGDDAASSYYNEVSVELGLHFCMLQFACSNCTVLQFQIL